MQKIKRSSYFADHSKVANIDYITLDSEPECVQKLAVQYCREAFYPAEKIVRNYSANFLKQWFTSASGGVYLTKRQFMQAMEKAGFPAELIRKDYYGQPDNWHFRISKKSPHFDTVWVKNYWEQEYLYQGEALSRFYESEPGLKDAATALTKGGWKS